MMCKIFLRSDKRTHLIKWCRDCPSTPFGSRVRFIENMVGVHELRYSVNVFNVKESMYSVLGIYKYIFSQGSFSEFQLFGKTK